MRNFRRNVRQHLDEHSRKRNILGTISLRNFAKFKVARGIWNFNILSSAFQRAFDRCDRHRYSRAPTSFGGPFPSSSFLKTLKTLYDIVELRPSDRDTARTSLPTAGEVGNRVGSTKGGERYDSDLERHYWSKIQCAACPQTSSLRPRP